MHNTLALCFCLGQVLTSQVFVATSISIVKFVFFAFNDANFNIFILYKWVLHLILHGKQLKGRKTLIKTGMVALFEESEITIEIKECYS